MAKKKTDKGTEAETVSAPVETDSGAEETEQEPVKPQHFRKQAQKEIGKKYQKIVQELAKKAAGGSVPHTKLLFDLGAVKEEVRAATPGKRRRRPSSLGKLLLDEVAKMKREKEKEQAAQAGETNKDLISAESCREE